MGGGNEKLDDNDELASQRRPDPGSVLPSHPHTSAIQSRVPIIESSAIERMLILRPGLGSLKMAEEVAGAEPHHDGLKCP